MDLSNTQLLTILLLAVCFTICLAAEEKTLKCYKCESVSKDDPCVDAKFDNSSDVETCTGPDAACVKIFSHVYGIVDGDRTWDANPPVFSRFCAKDHPTQDLGCTSTEGIKGKQTYCLCNDGDLCNSGVKLGYGLGLAAITMVFTFLWAL